MTLQASGTISLGNVNTELGLSATANIGMNSTNVRTLAGVASGAITMSNFYGKSNTPSGTLWGWGENSSGQVGNTTNSYVGNPVQIGTANWTSIAAGEFTTLAVKTDGTLWAWGSDPGYGTFGNGSASNSTFTPIQIGTATNWKSVSLTGLQYSAVAAIKTDGTLWTWGYNILGSLGLNDPSNGSIYSTPTQVGTLTNWKSVSVGDSYMIAIKTDGTLWGWGVNGNGRLGIGSTANKSSPVQIGTGTNWSTVSCGDTHAFAIKTDGTLWGWGSAGYGEQGNGNLSVDISSPTQLGSSTWKMVSCYRYQATMAIRSDDTLWAWGRGGPVQTYQTGISSAVSTPTQVGTSTWSVISAGFNRGMGICTDGTLWTWGQQAYGTSSYTTYAAPTQIGSLTTWKFLSSRHTWRGAFALI